MKIKNKTIEPRYLTSYGQRILVEPKQTVDLPKVIFDERSFEICEHNVSEKPQTYKTPNYPQSIEAKNTAKDFLKELKKIKGIGNKTAQDIVKVHTRESLISAIREDKHLPFRDDIASILIKNYAEEKEQLEENELKGGE